MKITSEKLEISPSMTIYWADLHSLRLLNDKLAFVLSDGQTIEVSNLSPLMVDHLFREYERYLIAHPNKNKSRTPRKR